jgi:Trypsin-like peptidase domain
MTAVEGGRATASLIDDPATSEVRDEPIAPGASDDDGLVTPEAETPASPDSRDEPAAPDVPAPDAPDDPPTSDASDHAAAPDDPTPPERPGPPQVPGRRPRPGARLVAAALLAAALLVTVGALLGGVAGALVVLHTRPPAPTPAAVPAAPADLADAVGAVLPAVLRIHAGAPDTGTAGTAVVLTPTGDVVTNEHLVHGETTATLIAANGQRSTARVVASDEKADIAWLRIDGATNLPTARLAGPGSVRLGEDVVAIGNALNLDGAPSITRGVVSAVGRSTATLDDVIQTDAAISSGSSGGALVDRSGAVVGITTEALVGDPSVSVEDIAFAIPSERVVTVLAGLGLVLPPGR